MIIFFVFIVLVVSPSSLKAQDKYVQKLYAYKEISDGSHRAPGRGNNADKGDINGNYLIYVELPQGSAPVWDTAIIGSHIYVVHSSLIQQTPLVIGERKKDNKLVRIKTAPSFQLWKLEFDLTDQKSASNAAAEGSVILKGALKNRRISTTVSGIIELASD